MSKKLVALGIMFFLVVSWQTYAVSECKECAEKPQQPQLISSENNPPQKVIFRTYQGDTAALVAWNDLNRRTLYFTQEIKSADLYNPDSAKALVNLGAGTSFDLEPFWDKLKNTPVMEVSFQTNDGKKYKGTIDLTAYAVIPQSETQIVSQIPVPVQDNKLNIMNFSISELDKKAYWSLGLKNNSSDVFKEVTAAAYKKVNNRWVLANPVSAKKTIGDGALDSFSSEWDASDASELKVDILVQDKVVLSKSLKFVSGSPDNIINNINLDFCQAQRVGDNKWKVFAMIANNNSVNFEDKIEVLSQQFVNNGWKTIHTDIIEGLFANNKKYYEADLDLSLDAVKYRLLIMSKGKQLAKSEEISVELAKVGFEIFDVSIQPDKNKLQWSAKIANIVLEPVYNVRVCAYLADSTGKWEKTGVCTQVNTVNGKYCLPVTGSIIGDKQNLDFSGKKIKLAVEYVVGLQTASPKVYEVTSWQGEINKVEILDAGKEEDKGLE